MSDFVPPVVQPPVSPTGEALLPAKYVPLALTLASLPGIVAGVFLMAKAFPQAQLWLLAISGGLWALLGVVSPGLRKPPSVGMVRLGTLVFLMLATALLGVLGGCATLKTWWSTKAEPAIIDCAKQDQQKLLDSSPVVVQALMSANWVGAIEQASQDLGDVAACVVAQLNSVPHEQLAIIQQAAVSVQANGAAWLAQKNVKPVNVPKPVVAQAP